MRPSFLGLSLLLFSVALAALPASASADPVRHGTKLIVMTPSPTQPNAPGLRMRTMVRPADHLWIGPGVPDYVPLEVGNAELELLDARPGGGLVATYRQRLDVCSWPKNCTATVKLFDGSGKETDSIPLGQFYSRPDQLEVQDVRVEGDSLYFNEACQTFSREALGKCSSLVAVDLTSKKVLWRTAPLTSNNELRIVRGYVVAAYGFTGEPARITVLRRKDGVVMDRQTLPGTNFEMTTKGDVLSVEIYHAIGTANFRMTGFDGAAPKLVPLPTTPPDPNAKPKPYDPPLQTRGPIPRATVF